VNVRIEDNTVRFRISPEELARLNDEGRLESAVQLYTEDGGALEGEFIYALAVEREFGATRCHIEPSFILFILHPGDLAILNAQPEAGFTHTRKSIGANGEQHLFKACVQVDRHKSNQGRARTKSSLYRE
jgi:hypothetical protein